MANVLTNKFMQLAINKAKDAILMEEVPVAAIIVHNNKILSIAHNLNRTNNDPCAHAEIIAIREAAKIKKSKMLNDCDIYVTLEPCAMCAGAISLARIKTLFYACADKKFGAVENGIRFFSSKSCLHRPDIYSGFFEDESRKILQDFFKSKRV